MQLAAVGYGVRHLLWKLGIKYVDVAPTQGKKFLLGKGIGDKNLI